MTYICANCGRLVEFEDMKGSMKHPYCSKCFKEVFNDDYDKYRVFMKKTHWSY